MEFETAAKAAERLNCTVRAIQKWATVVEGENQYTTNTVVNPAPTPTPNPTPEPELTPEPKPIPDTENPDAGDRSNMILWITLLILSACGLAAVAVVKKDEA